MTDTALGPRPVESLLDRHELLWSTGLVTESLHPGEMALSADEDRDVSVIASGVSKGSDDLKTSRRQGDYPIFRLGQGTQRTPFNNFAAKKPCFGVACRVFCHRGHHLDRAVDNLPDRLANSCEVDALPPCHLHIV